MFCAHWAVVEAMSAVPFQQPLDANFAFRLYTTSQCSSRYFFFKVTYSFVVYYTSPVNITSATYTRTMCDVWTLLPARWSDTSTAGGHWRRLPFWVTLPKWSVKESPSLSWIHVVHTKRMVLHIWQRQWAKPDLKFYWNLSNLKTVRKEGRNNSKNTSNIVFRENTCSKYFVLTNNQGTSVHFYLFGQVLTAPYSLSANIKKKSQSAINHNNINCNKDNDLILLKCWHSLWIILPIQFHYVVTININNKWGWFVMVIPRCLSRVKGQMGSCRRASLCYSYDVTEGIIRHVTFQEEPNITPSQSPDLIKLSETQQEATDSALQLSHSAMQLLHLYCGSHCWSRRTSFRSTPNARALNCSRMP